jgi:transcriptional regulator with XRE-family HTH domain
MQSLLTVAGQIVYGFHILAYHKPQQHILYRSTINAHLRSLSTVKYFTTITAPLRYSVMVKRYNSALALRLGQNLRHYRLRAKLTQEQLAEAIRVEVATVSRYETGVTLPSLVTLEALAALLHVAIADLLTEKKPVRSGEGEQLLAMLEPLSLAERNAVLKGLTTLVDVLREQNRAARASADKP